MDNLQSWMCDDREYLRQRLVNIIDQHSNDDYLTPWLEFDVWHKRIRNSFICEPNFIAAILEETGLSVCAAAFLDRN